MVAFFLYIVM